MNMIVKQKKYVVLKSHFNANFLNLVTVHSHLKINYSHISTNYLKEKKKVKRFLLYDNGIIYRSFRTILSNIFMTIFKIA